MDVRTAGAGVTARQGRAAGGGTRREGNTSAKHQTRLQLPKPETRNPKTETRHAKHRIGERNNLLATVSAAILLPLCLLRDFTLLSYTSMLGVAGVLYTALFMAWRKLEGSYAPGGTFYTQIPKVCLGAPVCACPCVPLRCMRVARLCVSVRVLVRACVRACRKAVGVAVSCLCLSVCILSVSLGPCLCLCGV